MKKYNILSSLFIAAVFGGCVSDYEPNYTGALSDKEISFKVTTATPGTTEVTPVGQEGRADYSTVQDGFLDPIKAVSDYPKPMYLHTLISSVPDTSAQASRATQYTAASDITNFGVLAYRYASTGSATTPNFLYNSEFQKNGTKWSSVNKYYWPVNSDKLDFYAYAPYNNANITLSSESTSGVPTMEFVVNPDASLQVDLVTAKALTQDLSAANTGVPLTFNHHLTTVKFVLGEDMLGTVETITFKNIYTAGKLTFAGTWDFTGKTRGDFTVPYNTNTLLMPQNFSDQAQKIEVVYNDGYQRYTLVYNLQGTSWTAGKAVTYCINSSAVTELKLGSITFATGLSELPKTAWANGDAVGLYAVESATGTVKYTNVRLTYSTSTGKWSLPENTKIVYTPKYEYYVYYPYSTSGLAHTATAGAKMNSRAAASTSAQFFATGISNWTIPTDQTALATINNTDLQTSRGAVSVSDAATLNFTMVREMSLCKVTLGSKTIPHTRTYNANSTTDYSDNYTKSVKAAANFNGTGGIKPYHSGTSDNYYAIVRPSTSTQQIKCATGIANGWANHPVTANITKGNMGAYTVQSDSTVIFMARAYSYTGSVQTFTAPIATTYRLEVWGAQGGQFLSDRSSIPCGGYSCGYFSISNKNTKLYIEVGGQGYYSGPTFDTPYNKSGGYNGGGNAGNSGSSGGGGGATHISKSNKGVLANYFYGTNDILIVAGGGGGCGASTIKGGVGGGTNGGNSAGGASGGTQTSGYAFGKGQDVSNGKDDGGGGGGYFGGYSLESDKSGGGGSGYIGGVTNGITIAGDTNMPSTNGVTETGHSGNGYCKITWHPTL